MTTVKTVPQILNDAADILEQENAWTQGDYHTRCDTAPSGVSHCADGALAVAAGIVSGFHIDEHGDLRYNSTPWDDMGNRPARDAYELAYRAASDYTRAALGFNSGIIGFNDADGRTQGEVVQALRGAARQASELVPA